MQKVFLIFGPSGSGKSTVAEEYAKKYNFLNYEIDRPGGSDGIDFYQIREQWDIFLNCGQPQPLLTELIQRAKKARKRGLVMSLPSMIPDHRLLATAQNAGLASIILYGTAEECLTAFRRREKETGRNFSDEHWFNYNALSYIKMGFSEYSSFRISTFINGKRIKLNKILDDISKRII